MKKNFMLVCIALLLAMTLIISCDNSSKNPDAGKFTVSFDTDGGGVINPVKVGLWQTVAEPEKPTKEGYIFVEWQLDGKAYDFKTPVTKNITLTAIWKFDGVEVSDEESFISAINKGSNIKLTSDIVLSSRIKILDKDIIIDLAGKKITPTSDLNYKGGLFLIDNGGKLTIEDSVGTGVIDVTKGEKDNFSLWACFSVWPDSGYKSELIINGGTFIAGYYPISGNGTCKEEDCTKIIINNGKFNSLDGLAIYHPQNGSLTINNGEFNGQESAVEIRSGKLNINGGIFTATNKPASSTQNGNGTTSNGVAIAVAQHTTKLPINVKISGGTFNGYSALYESNPQNNDSESISKVKLEVSGGTFNATNGGNVAVYSEDCKYFITGGTFSTKPNSEYIASGYKVVGTSSPYTVSANN